MFYGAAQFSKDIDFLLLADEANFVGLHAALGELGAERIAVPKFDPDLLNRGHAVHFRCQSGDAKGLRIDVMTRLRDLPDFHVLWNRRTTLVGEDKTEIHLLSVEDLVAAKASTGSRSSARWKPFVARNAPAPDLPVPPPETGDKSFIRRGGSRRRGDP